MKKLTIALVVICVLAISLCACDVNTECEHSFGEWIETKAATCSAVGEEQRTCSKCQEVETREIEMVSHTFGEWVETKAATVTEQGEEARECSVCHTKETRSVAKLTDGKVTDYAYEGGLYTGAIVNGLPNDDDAVYSKDGLVFNGKFVNGVAKAGKLTYARTTGLVEYSGSFVAFNEIDTSVDGEGYFVYGDGCNYRGGIKANDSKGEGVLFINEGTFKWFGTENVDTFVGTYENGAPVSGIKTFADGNKYEGYFSSDYNFNGKGKFTFANGMYYEGDFVNGARHGDGKFSWSTDGNYEGNWRYEGKFENGEPTYGTKYFATRSEGVLQFTGKFVNLDKVDTSVSGSGIYSYGNGCWYQGEMTVSGDHADGCLFNGDGKFYWGLEEATWTVYEGNFTNSGITEGTIGTKTWKGREAGVLIYKGSFANLDNIDIGVNGVAYVKDENHDGWYNITALDGQAGTYTIISVYHQEIENVIDFEYEGGLYTGIVADGIPNDDNAKYTKDGLLFEGAFVEGVATKGKLTYNRESGLLEYSGKFIAFNRIDTSVTGEGYFYYENACNYRGGIQAQDEIGENITFAGEGTFKWFGTENVDTFVGTYENGAPVSGIKTFANGNKYEGDFSSDYNFNGKGKFTFANGMYYEGDFVNGARHGDGKFSWSTDGNYEGNWRYEGKFENDQPTVGTKYSPTRESGVKEYTGKFLNLDAIDTSVAGSGYYVYPDGCTYRGGMISNDGLADSVIFHGNGTFTWTNGDTFVGTYDNGAPVSGTKTFIDGNTYTGGFNGAYNFDGKGKFTFANGMYYEGDFVNGVRHGDGKFSWSTDGNYEGNWRYEGKFENGEPTYGTKYFATRSEGVLQFTGKFVNLDKVDTSVSGSGIYSYGNGCWYQGEMTVSGDHADGCLFNGDGKFYWGLEEATWTVYEGNFTNSGITEGTIGTKTWKGREAGVLIYKGSFANLDNIDIGVNGVAYVKDENHDGWYNITALDGQAGTYTIISEYVEE